MRSKTNFRVSFFLKKTKLLKSGEASVSMRITVDGQRVENNIRKSILPNLWDRSKERAKGTSKTAIDLNRFIEEARIKIHQIITELQQNGEEITPVVVQQRFSTASGKSANRSGQSFRSFRNTTRRRRN